MHLRGVTSSRGMRPASCLLALAVLPATALADDSNYRPYLIGARAGGMGGAFTALADDPSGPYYNPAGIVVAKKSQLSLSGSLFGLVSESTKDALGDVRDFDSADLQTFPIQTSGIYKLGPDPPEKSPDAVAFSIFVPTSVTQSGRDYLGTQQSSFSLAFSEDDVWVGPTYAHRFGRRCVGACLFGMFVTPHTAAPVYTRHPPPP